MCRRCDDRFQVIIRVCVATMENQILNAMTVDVEDYFHPSAFRHVVRFEDWAGLESRVERNTRRVLQLLAEFSVQGTFFILGWVAERFPGLVREIQSAGHEIGCHSYAHRLIYEMTPKEFCDDTERALRAIEDATGVQARSYRAPSFSITPRSLWAIAILLELGFTHDSSMFPVRHDLYGFSTAPRQPFRICVNGRSLVEVPPPTMKFGPWTLPVTGGGYLRTLPLRYQFRAMEKLQKRGESFLLYFHPWELDRGQPRIDGPLRSRFRQYTGLARTESRLRKLLQAFRFGRLCEASQNVLRTYEIDSKMNLAFAPAFPNAQRVGQSEA